MCLRVDILTFIKCTNFFPANYNYVSMIFDWFFRTPKTLSFNQFGMSDFPFWMKQIMPNLRPCFQYISFMHALNALLVLECCSVLSSKRGLLHITGRHQPTPNTAISSILRPTGGWWSVTRGRAVVGLDDKNSLSKCGNLRIQSKFYEITTLWWSFLLFFL